MDKKRKLLVTLLTTEEEESEKENLTNKIVSYLRDDDDEAEMLLRLALPTKRMRNSIQNYCDEVVESYTNEEFIRHFRVNREIFEKLASRLEKSQPYIHLRADKRLSGRKHMLLFLWYTGHEACSIRDISDRFDVSLSSVNHIIVHVTTFLSDLSEEVTTWPNSSKMSETEEYFKNKSGIPKIIDAIDGTHIVIDPPSEGKDDYIDRKGLTSIILQGICDENRKFIDIFVGYPGSAHESRVLQNSFIYPKLESLCKDKWILGDSAYPLKKNLLTPYKDNGHLTAAQSSYNRNLSSSRVVIEHAFGMLKQRFRQLYYCKLKGMEKLCHYVRACCVLHNLASESDLDFSEEPLETGVDQANNFVHTEFAPNPAAKALRDSVCLQMWQSQGEH